MAIENYGQLKTTLEEYLVRDNIVNQIETLISLGEVNVNTDLRIREMEATENITITASTAESPLPTGFLQGKTFYIDGVTKDPVNYKNLVPYRELWANQTPAQPEVYAIRGKELLWGPVPDTGYTAVAEFYKKLDPFVDDADTNDVLLLAPNVYVYAALKESAPFLGDDQRIAVWASMYEDIVRRLTDQDARAMYSGDTREPEVEAQRT